MTTCPAIVTVPLRAGPSFDWIPSGIVEFPEPLAFIGGIEIHGALLAAVQLHSGAVVMLTFCELAVAGAAIVSGETVAEQPDSCVTVKV